MLYILSTIRHLSLGKLTLILLSVFLIQVSCKSKKELTKETKPESKSVKPKNPQELMADIAENEFRYENLSIKATAEIKVGEKNHSLKTTIRIKKDSIIWISIAPLMGIEAARMILTQDSVKVMNRLKSNYFEGGYDYISENLDADVNFQIAQAFIIGNSLPLEENAEEPLRISHDHKQYVISSLKRKKLKRRIEKREKIENNEKKLERKSEKFDDVIESVWFSPEHDKIVKQSINDLATQRSIEAVYSNFGEVEGIMGKIPFQVEFFINADSTSTVVFTSSKIVAQEDAFPFKIPEKYERVY